MGINKINPSNALFTKVQQLVLGLLFNRPDKAFYTNEIIRLSKAGTGAVQRELAKLTAAGLVTVQKIGNQKHYQANRSAPLFNELRSIILKTFGLADVILAALQPLINKIDFAFIYGSIAKQEETANSDIDLMIIADGLTYSDLFNLLEKTETQLGRKINSISYSPMEWMRKSNEGNNFITQVQQNPKIFLIGTEDEFGKFRELVQSWLIDKRDI